MALCGPWWPSPPLAPVPCSGPPVLRLLEEEAEACALSHCIIIPHLSNAIVISTIEGCLVSRCFVTCGTNQASSGSDPGKTSVHQQAPNSTYRSLPNGHLAGRMPVHGISAAPRATNTPGELPGCIRRRFSPLASASLHGGKEGENSVFLSMPSGPLAVQRITAALDLDQRDCCCARIRAGSQCLFPL